MKKFILSIAVALTSWAVSAQYVPTAVGTASVYTSTQTEENVSVTSDETVTAATVGDNDILNIELTSIASVPGNDFAKVTTKSKAEYNPATKVTTYVEMDAESFKEFITNMVVQAAESQGHMVTDTEREELDKNLKPKGSLMIEIDPAAAEGTVQKDCTLSMNMGQQRMLMKWGKITFVGFEEVTVPAGTFKCAKFTYTVTASMGEAPTKEYVTAWFAEGTGKVKEVTADKKGNVKSEMVLTSFTPAVVTL